jgi:hypothetical protein
VKRTEADRSGPGSDWSALRASGPTPLSRGGPRSATDRGSEGVRESRSPVRYRPPAGHWPVNQLFPWVVVAGCSLACSVCGAEGRAPLPKTDPVAYSRRLEGWLLQHRGCVIEGRDE